MKEEKTKLDILKKIVSIIVIVILISILSFLGMNAFKTDEKVNHPKVTFDIEGKGKMVMELYPEKAPNTVKNFLTLVNSGYYNEKVIYGKDINTIHVGRNQDGTEAIPTKSMIDPEIKKGSEKDTEYNIEGEFADNNFTTNDLKHTKYMVSMSRANYTQLNKALVKESYNSASGLFNIIMGEHAAELDGKYAVFGKIIEGQNIVDEIFNMETNVKENQENKFQLRRFYPYIKIKSAVADTKESYKVKYIDAFSLDNYYNDMVKEYNKKHQTKVNITNLNKKEN